MKRIGCFFGTFDPVHVGHLIIAQHMLQYAGLEEVWLMVSPQNPFKQDQVLTADHIRLEMAKAALKGTPNMRASDLELTLPRPSYTASTLSRMRADHPELRFDVIMGSDNLAGLHRWKDPESIIENHRVLVYPRPGLDEHIEQAAYQGHTSVNLIDAPMLDIAATRIRSMAAEGLDVRFLVTEPVRELIQKHKLYQVASC